MDPVKIVLTGGCGQMGKQLIRSFQEDGELDLVGVIDRNNLGIDAGVLAGLQEIGLKVTSELEEFLEKMQVDIMVDFTCHEGACENIEIAIKKAIPSVVGTTGFNEEELQSFDKKAREKGIPLFIAPNFAIGAVLMMKFACMASRYFLSAEIIELHHNRKKDAPSGTSITTARGMMKNFSPIPSPVIEKELIPGVRGGNIDGIKIHSIRLPGLIAHQEVLMGGTGEVLTIRHDTIGREAFMPGVILAIKKVKTLLPGLTFGLDKLLEL